MYMLDFAPAVFTVWGVGRQLRGIGAALSELS